MRFSRFFIDRPIFAVVLSLVILAGGLIAVTQLPISEYPEVTPPTITVSAIYPGANPSVLAQTVGTPLEDAINGVERMLYMTSSASPSRSALTSTSRRYRCRTECPRRWRDCPKRCALSVS